MVKKISVITVTYNSEKYIEGLIISLDKYLRQPFEVIIVDNASTDQTVALVKKYPTVKLIGNKENVGFGKANNQAAKHASGEILFLLNPDTRLTEKIDPLINYLDNDGNVGIVSPKLILSDGRIQASVKKLPTLERAIREYFFGQKNEYLEYVPASAQPVEVECIYGAALLMKKELFDQLGGFDERYFMYYEDVDLNKRVRELGKKIIYFPNISLFHQLGGSIVTPKPLPFGIRTLTWFFPIKGSGKIEYIVRSQMIYHGFLTAFLIRLVMFISVKLGLDR